MTIKDLSSSFSKAAMFKGQALKPVPNVFWLINTQPSSPATVSYNKPSYLVALMFAQDVVSLPCGSTGVRNDEASWSMLALISSAERARFQSRTSSAHSCPRFTAPGADGHRTRIFSRSNRISRFFGVCYLAI